MIAFKFLRAGGVGPFTGFAWPLPCEDEPGDWVGGDASAGAASCASGVHACRPADLPVWLSDELWEAELAGRVVEARSKVVAPRGRLLRRVDAWDGAAASAFSEACARRARHHAAAVARAAGLGGVASELQALTLAEVADAPALVPPGTGARVEAALGYASDAAAMTRGGAAAASVAYIAVRAALHAADAPAGAVRERAWQAGWLRDRLSLAR